MKRKKWGSITLIAILGACLFIDACISKEAESDAGAGPVKSSIEPSAKKHAQSVMATETWPAPVALEASKVVTAPVDVNAQPTYSIDPTVSATASPVTPSPDTSIAPSSVPLPVVPISVTSESVREVSIPVLNYHSLGVKEGSTIVLDPEKFARQMEYMANNSFTPLSLSDFILILEKRKPAPAKPVLLTFDDGYSDNYEYAMPVLKQYHFPATLFMTPGSVGQEGYLDWEQVKEMSEAGWDIEPHGMTHPHLPQLSGEKQRKEITEASRLIEEQLGKKADVFCYPYGEFNEQTLNILKEEGFRYAFTILQGMTTSSQHPYKLKRIYVNAQDSLSGWSKKLFG